MRERCPTCGRPRKQPAAPSRICFLCKRPIIRHDKFTYDNAEGYSRLKHRDCSDPEGYPNILYW